MKDDFVVGTLEEPHVDVLPASVEVGEEVGAYVKAWIFIAIICAAVRGGIHVAGIAQHVVEVGGNSINPLGVHVPVAVPYCCQQGAKKSNHI